MMKKIIISTVLTLILIVSSAYAENVLSVYLDVYKNNSVKLKEMKVMSGRPTEYTNPGDYKLQILDSDNEVMVEKSISLNFMIMTDPPTESDVSSINQKIEFNTSMKYLKLFLNENEIFSKELVLCNNNGICNQYESYLSCPSDCPLKSRDGICIKDRDGTCDPDCSEGADPDCQVVSDKCGNGICDSGENYKLCSKDCPSGTKDSFCDSVADGKCDPDCSQKEDVDCVKPSNRIFIYIIIGVVAIALLAFIFLKSRKEETVACF